MRRRHRVHEPVHRYHVHGHRTIFALCYSMSKGSTLSVGTEHNHDDARNVKVGGQSPALLRRASGAPMPKYSGKVRPATEDRMLRHTNASRAKTLNATHSSVKTVFTTTCRVVLRTDHVKLIKDEADVHLDWLGA